MVMSTLKIEDRDAVYTVDKPFVLVWADHDGQVERKIGFDTLKEADDQAAKLERKYGDDDHYVPPRVILMGAGGDAGGMTGDAVQAPAVTTEAWEPRDNDRS